MHMLDHGVRWAVEELGARWGRSWSRTGPPQAIAGWVMPALMPALEDTARPKAPWEAKFQQTSLALRFFTEISHSVWLNLRCPAEALSCYPSQTQLTEALIELQGGRSAGNRPADPNGQPDPGTHWAKTTTGKHKVFVDGGEPKDEEELVVGLTAEGILRGPRSIATS
ncbi:hypothetical protein M441DRAFT_91235 [Trichoderma asperellum CBS 433.97]|uniref:Uncharacterized protein n=1 Tax=Trichoderma asperellum (strain ATCC 204424 / CBS 433.97 / NBRC 101777) TaxID=1042311 RepID=A0A2T3Z198_TRIA4|nr:hypothetical protein M441DRAFT_91235 [Trichoderma asperellum CBS 433.97]PTB38594.1 hypothetical protein M441DRAFT_91235 [Trichoderma asperellum CBS 433.97]